MNPNSYNVTTFQSACASIAKLEYAINYAGLDLACREPNFARAAGRYASEEVLLWARDHGMPWSFDICVGAAEASRFNVMKRLHNEHGAPLAVGDIARAAALHGADTLSILQWLWDQASLCFAFQSQPAFFSEQLAHLRQLVVLFITAWRQVE
jgi:hypothetical protein